LQIVLRCLGRENAITVALSDEETMENIDLDTEMRYNLPSKLGNQLQTGSPKSIWVIPGECDASRLTIKGQKYEHE